MPGLAHTRGQLAAVQAENTELRAENADLRARLAGHDGGDDSEQIDNSLALQEARDRAGYEEQRANELQERLNAAEENLREALAKIDALQSRLNGVDDDSGDVSTDRISYQRMKMDELSALARSRGLQSKGTKAELIARLEEHDGR